MRAITCWRSTGRISSGKDDVSRLLENTAGKPVLLKIGADASGANAREITVVPIASEAQLRHAEWIEDNRRKVDELSGGKLAYVYMPDTAQGGLTNFNRYYFAQSDKQGAMIDERFNSGGQVADYVIEAMRRQLMGFWSPRYGAIYRTPAAAILGPKVMIINELAGSGGDAMPWMFRYTKIGPLVGKRTWGGLIGVSAISRVDGWRQCDRSQLRILQSGGPVGRGEPRGRAGRGSGDGPETGQRRPRPATGAGCRHDAPVVGEESAGRAQASRVPELSASRQSRPQAPVPAAGRTDDRLRRLSTSFGFLRVSYEFESKGRSARAARDLSLWSGRERS